MSTCEQENENPCDDRQRPTARRTFHLRDFGDILRLIDHQMRVDRHGGELLSIGTEFEASNGRRVIAPHVSTDGLEAGQLITGDVFHVVSAGEEASVR